MGELREIHPIELFHTHGNIVLVNIAPTCTHFYWCFCKQFFSKRHLKLPNFITKSVCAVASFAELLLKRHHKWKTKQISLKLTISFLNYHRNYFQKTKQFK